MMIRLYRPQDESSWDDFVKQSPTATLYHQIGWKEVIEKSFGHRGHYWLSQDLTGKINGILPLVHLKSVLFGSFMVSLPYFNYGGVCAEEDAVRSDLLGAAVEGAKKAGATHIEFRQQAPMQTDLPLKTSKVSMQLVLPSSSDQLWNSFSSRLRNKIKRPEKEKMHVRIGNVDELESFYEVFSINMRDLGTPVYSKDFFKNILKEFPDSTRICTVYSGSKPVASSFLVGFREKVEIPWVSSRRHYNRHYPNFLLYWTVLKFACDHGYKIFDFGRSTPEEGTYQFKEQWGARPVPLYWYYWVKNGGALPELNPKNPRYRMAIYIWKKLPVELTKLIGPPIVRNLP